MEDITYIVKNGQVDTKIKKICFRTDNDNVKPEMYVEQGYSVFHISYNKRVNIFINKKISREDESLIMRTWSHILDSYPILCMIVLVNIRDDDYDFMYFMFRDFDKILPSLACLLHEKLDKLTIQEQQIMNEYRHFSLENLLCNDKLSQNIINNHHCGVMAIYPNQMIAKTNTKNSHDVELDNIDKKVNAQGYNKIEVRILSYGIIITLPMDRLTDYQIDCLDKLMDEISLLIKKYSVNKEMHVGINGLDIITVGALDDSHILKVKQYIANIRKECDNIYEKCKLSN